MKVCLDTIDKVKAFVDNVPKVDADIDLSSYGYIVDAKSIMRILANGRASGIHKKNLLLIYYFYNIDLRPGNLQVFFYAIIILSK